MNYKSHLFTLFLFIFGLNSFSQDIYPLHPSIGDTLDAVEKLDYSLFPSISNSNYQFGTITFEGDTFYLNNVFLDSTSKKVLSKELIVEAQQNIEKINAFYRLQEREATEQKKDNYYTNKASGKSPVLFNEAMNEQMKKQARMNLRLKEDARRQREHENGIRPNQLRIEFN